MGRIGRSFKLLASSWEVLKADRELMLLPLMSFAAILVSALVFGGLASGLGLIEFTEGEQLTPGGYAVAGLFYLTVYFVGIFFNAAIVAAANIRLEGGDPTVVDGLRAAWSKAGKILGWAALAATVGLILRSIEERVGLVGRIVVGIIGVAWSVATFFVVPILLFEPLGVVDSVKRSGTLFRARWGEQFTGSVSIGIAMALVSVPAIILSTLLIVTVPVVGAVVAVLAFGLVASAGSAMSGIFNAALYRYAAGAATGDTFGEEQLREAFTPKTRGLFNR